MGVCHVVVPTDDPPPDLINYLLPPSPPYDLEVSLIAHLHRYLRFGVVRLFM